LVIFPSPSIFFTSAGSSIEAHYKPSTHYRDAEENLLNPELPIIIDTVEFITYNDGLGNYSTTTYEYAGGKMWYSNPKDKRFAGFAEVKKIDGEGNITKSYFLQGENNYPEINRPYKVELLDSDENILLQTEINYFVHDFANASSFIAVESSVEKTFNSSTYKSKAEGFEYNANTGNLTRHIQYGEVDAAEDGTFVDILGDKRTVEYTYANSSLDAAFSGFPSKQILKDNEGTKVSEVEYYYDNLGFGNVSSGNQTQTRSWISGSDYSVESLVYDSYDLPIEHTDANGNVSYTTYDAYKMHPATVRNELGHIIWYTYEYAYGNPTYILDPNGFASEYSYDGKGRLLEQKITDPAGGQDLVLKTKYIYTDNIFPRKIEKQDYLNEGSFVRAISYINGYEMPIQERRESSTAGVYLTKDFYYNKNQQLSSDSLPYESSGEAMTEASANNNFYTHYTYDALGREYSIQNILGITTHDYDLWSDTLTDALGNQKKYHYDAFGQLTGVDEYNEGEVYNTRYTYSALGNLTNITDALGNVRNFGYDGIGRRVLNEDLHAVEDSNFSVYEYEYDAAGNIIEELRPNGDTVVFAYDELNRIVSEAVGTEDNIQMEYIYDNCDYGKGRLCASITTEVFTQFDYDTLGNVASENRVIDSIEYEISSGSAYDRQGNLQSIEYPDGSVVSYNYDSAGFLSSVSRDGEDIIASIEYNPLLLIKKITYGNGVVSENIFDATKLYRLEEKRTYKGANNLQNISYVYDVTGNILEMTDSSSNLAAKLSTFTYDDLYRLKTATITNAANGENYTKSYSYDALGNILNKSDVGDYLYEGESGFANPHAATSIGGEVLTYDKNGNVTETGDLELTWDYNNRLIQTTSKISSEETYYAYDHSGQRIYKASSEGITIYPNKYLEFRDGELVQYIYAGSSAIATVEGDSLYYNHNDHLSGSNVITDELGDVVQLLDYYPFGEIRMNEKTEDHDETKKFTGYEYDDESELYYANARYYDGSVGRFFGVDVVPLKTPEQLLGDPQGLQLYAYARNNPFKYVDPTGNYFDTVIDGAFMVIDLGQMGYGKGQKIVGNLTDNNDLVNKGKGNIEEGALALGADAMSAAIPGAIGGGLIARGTKRSLMKGGKEVAENAVVKSQKKNLVTKSISLQPAAGISESVTKSSPVRIKPLNLQEKLTLDEAKYMSNPKKIIKNTDINDTKYNNLYSKYEHIHSHPDGTKTNIHFMEHITTKDRIDFKFVDRKIEKNRSYLYRKN